MKTIRINVTLFICLLTMLIPSCTYDSLPTYEDVDRIYFTWSKIPGGSDKVGVLFGYDTPVKSDSTIFIPVSLMGHVSGQDRAINAKLIKSESSAVEEQDIEILPSFIPAGKEIGTLSIRINNTEKLETTTLIARIRLAPNEHFHVDFSKVLGSSEKNGLEYNIYFHARNEAPSLWADPEGRTRLDIYFGEYSKVKLQVICDVCGITPDFFKHDTNTQNAMEVINTRMPTSLVMGMIAQVNRYLDQYYEEHKENLTDENGKVIKMGTTIK